MESMSSPAPEWSPDDRGPAARSLVVIRRLDGPRLVLRVLGEADVGSVRDLRDGLRRALALALDEVSVDLSGLTFCDLAGLDALDDFVRDAADRGLTTSVHGMSPVLSWLHDTFPPHGDNLPLAVDRPTTPDPGGPHPTGAPASPADEGDPSARDPTRSPRPWPVR